MSNFPFGNVFTAVPPPSVSIGTAIRNLVIRKSSFIICITKTSFTGNTAINLFRDRFIHYNKLN